MKRLSLVLTALGLVCTTACGGLPNNEGAESTLVTLQGEVQNQSGTLSGNDIHVALVWANGQNHTLAVETPIKPVFPAAFQLSITSAPPSDFVVPVPELDNAQAAYGAVVAYQDRNGDGKLDFVDANAKKFVDYVVGADMEHFIVFFQSQPPDDANLKDKNGALPHAGFNIETIDDSTSPNPTFTWAPLTTNLELTADTSADLQSVMCSSGSTSVGGGGTVNAPAGVIGPNNQYPQPNDPNLTCDFGTDPDEYGYTVDQTTVSRPCYTEESSVTTIYSKSSGSTPPGWPCP
jgi:hypothetical protein